MTTNGNAWYNRSNYNVRKTRFKELGYISDAPGLWRIVDMDGQARVGPQYTSLSELLADLERFATQFGCR